MKIGKFIGVTDPAPTLEGQIRQIVSTESDGFDSLWSNQGTGVDALTLLALGGQRTERVELGTAVVPLRFLRDPMLMAQAALTTQAAAGGRFSMGIGGVSRPAAEEWRGFPFKSPAVYMREYLSVLRALVHEGSVDFAGEVFRVNTALQVPSATPFPILVAALQPAMLRLAGELSEGTVTWMVGRKTLETHIVPQIAAAAQAAGRPAPRICVGVPICVTDDPTAARERAATLFHGYGRRPHYRRMLDIEGVDDPADVVIIGDEVEVERQLRIFADAGATDLLASIFSAGEDADASITRTRDLLRSLVAKI